MQTSFAQVNGDSQHYVEKVRVKVRDYATLSKAAVTISGQLCGYVNAFNFDQVEDVELTCV